MNGLNMQDENSYSKINPVVIFGIILCCVPVIGNIMGKQWPAWTYSFGIVMILIGAVISVIQMFD